MQVRQTINEFFIKKEEIIVTLRNIGKSATQIARESENKILDVIEKLKYFKKKSSDIYSLSSEVYAIVDNRKFFDNVESINGILKDLEERLLEIYNLTEKSELKLLATINSFEKINDKLQNFKRIIKRLKMLAISNRIECSRLKEGMEDFLTLAASIEDLGDKISRMIEEIRNKSAQLSEKILESVNNVSLIRNKQKEILNLKIEEQESIIKEMENKRARVAENSHSMRKYFEEYKNNFSELISSFQFQDITRQRIEHVEENLSSLISEYEALNKDELNVDALAELDYKAKKVLLLQKEQILDSVDKYVAALENAQSSYSKIALSSKEIIEQTEKNSRSSEGGLTGFEKIKNEIEKMAFELTENSEISKEMVDLIKFVGDILKELSSFIEQIEDIAIDVQLIALNANIKAAKTGQNGASLSVLADAVKDLSDEARVLIDDISNSLFVVSESSRELELNKFEENFERMREKYKDIKESLDNVTNNLNEMSVLCSQKTAELLAQTSQFFKDIENEIESIENAKLQIENLKFLANEIENVESDLNNEIFSIKNFYNVDLSKYEKNYTMHDERKLSAKVLGKKEKRIEENDFGDNVTLF